MATNASSAGDGIGSLSLLIESGNGATGLSPGTKVESIADGWTVRYEKLLVVLHGVTAGPAGSGLTLTNPYLSIIVDLTVATDAGTIVSGQYSPGEYETVEFSLRVPDGNIINIRSDETDAKLMADLGYSIYILGSMTNPNGQSCTPGKPTECTPATEIAFEWGLSGERSFIGCDGFTISRDQTTVALLTLPADRWFLSDFSVDADLVPRRAQWLADADLDHDGTTTFDELRSIQASELFTKENGYDLGGAPIPIETAYDFLQAQIYTIGLDPSNGCTRSSAL